jgi:hypothetical protein
MLLAVALWAPAAQAAPTRAEFVGQAESICKATNGRYAKIAKKQSKQLVKHLKGIQKGNKPGQKKPSKRQERRLFSVLIRIVGRSMVLQGRSIHDIDRQLAPIAEPSGDEPAIAQWIESRRVDAEALKQAGKSLKATKNAKPKQFFALIFQSFAINDRLVATDWIVGAFGFSQCLLAEEEEPTL